MVKSRYKPKYVTVCLANAARSPTAQWLLQQQGYKVRSCGVSSVAIEQCDEQRHMDWADRVFVMEDYMKKDLSATYPWAKDKITVLKIPEIGEHTCQPSLLRKISKSLNDNGVKTRPLQPKDKNLWMDEQRCGKWFGEEVTRKNERLQFQPRRHSTHVAEYEEEWKRLHPPMEEYEYWYPEPVPAWHIAEGEKRLQKQLDFEAKTLEDVEKLFKVGKVTKGAIKKIIRKLRRK